VRCVTSSQFEAPCHPACSGAEQLDYICNCHDFIYERGLNEVCLICRYLQYRSGSAFVTLSVVLPDLKLQPGTEQELSMVRPSACNHRHDGRSLVPCYTEKQLVVTCVLRARHMTRLKVRSRAQSCTSNNGPREYV
jgi:hypothetical protein